MNDPRFMCYKTFYLTFHRTATMNFPIVSITKFYFMCLHIFLAMSLPVLFYCNTLTLTPVSIGFDEFFLYTSFLRRLFRQATNRCRWTCRLSLVSIRLFWQNTNCCRCPCLFSLISRHLFWYFFNRHEKSRLYLFHHLGLFYVSP